MTTIDTKYFVDWENAIDFYRKESGNPAKKVACLINVGLVRVGIPNLDSGERCYIKDGQYYIDREPNIKDAFWGRRETDDMFSLSQDTTKKMKAKMVEKLAFRITQKRRDSDFCYEYLDIDNNKEHSELLRMDNLL